ncbi:hypothetical protein L914_07325 [Phytophthora nicotianae]|uniref:DUF4038 domain-containing protein n=1 Tax=Phytophthora nicotianae TaxID=4792 RepID=W2NHL6_PHYNI|nr:hypothetical protein L914_07325 [Phytophthora nicotianae]
MQPNEAYFELIDWAVERAASYGAAFNDSTAYEWGKYIGGRYPGVPKILGGDTNCLWARNLMEASISYPANPVVDPATLVGTIEDTTHLWVNMRSGVKDGEAVQGYEAVVLFHPTSGRIARPVSIPEAIGHLMLPKEEDRVSIDAVQSGHATPESLGSFTPYEAGDSTKNYELIAKMLDGFTGPVLGLENHYEGGHYNFDPSFPVWNASEVRTGLYNGVYSGAAGFTYGANSVWQMYEPAADLLRASDYYEPSVNQNVSGSWRRDIFFEGATQIQHVTKPLQNLTIEQLELLEPGRQLLASPNGHTDVAVNAYDGTRFISVLASKTNDRYYVYTGHGGSFSLNLGNGLARSGTARWFSPRDGEYYADSVVDVNANNAFIDFIPPSGGGVDNAWLLVLEFSDLEARYM